MKSMLSNQETISLDMFQALERSFHEFQTGAQKLAHAYESMQEDFKKLNLELDRKNKELAESLAHHEETQRYLNAILQSMSNGVIGVDVEGTVTQFNDAASKITGCDSSMVLGKKWNEVLATVDKTQDCLPMVLEKGTGYAWNEKVLWHKNGSPVSVAFQSELLRDQNNNIIGAVEILSDISRIKDLEREMQQARTMAALGEMSATVAHEIRNPLGAMGVWAGLLERDIDEGDSRRETLRKIIDGLSRLNKIVSNLLVYSRPFNAQFRNVQINRILSETVDFVEIEIGRLNRHITLERHFDHTEDLIVRADPEKMQQVIMNLCLNALQAMQDEGTLTIQLLKQSRENTDYACFKITDTGSGIDDERIEKIFDPFHTTKENGTGLGLAIVKKFVEHHSGYISVHSILAEGTTFSVFLPLEKHLS